MELLLEMTKEHPFYTLSHDSKDAPHFTHRAYLVKSPMKEIGELIAIMDEDKSHLAFMRGWINCEIDIETRWTLNNGVFGVDIALYRNKKNKVLYNVKLTVAQAEKILRTPLNAMAICDERKRIILYIKPLKINQLFQFYKMKHDTDRYMIDNLISSRGWHVD